MSRKIFKKFIVLSLVAVASAIFTQYTIAVVPNGGGGGGGAPPTGGSTECPTGTYCLSVPIPTKGLPGGARTIQDPAEYIKTIYQFALGIGALLAIGIIVFGGIEYTVSAGNVSRQGEAKDRILNAIYGLVLLMAATLILYTIDPRLVGLRLAELPQAEFAPPPGQREALNAKDRELRAKRDSFDRPIAQKKSEIAEGRTEVANLKDQGKECEAAKAQVEKVEQKRVELQKLLIAQQEKIVEIDVNDRARFNGDLDRDPQSAYFLGKEGQTVYDCLRYRVDATKLPSASYNDVAYYAADQCGVVGKVNLLDEDYRTFVFGLTAFYANERRLVEMKQELEKRKQDLTTIEADLAAARKNAEEKCKQQK